MNTPFLLFTCLEALQWWVETACTLLLLMCISVIIQNSHIWVIMSGGPHSVGPVVCLRINFPISRCRFVVAMWFFWNVHIRSFLNASCFPSVSFSLPHRLTSSSLFILSVSFTLTASAFLRQSHILCLSACQEYKRTHCQTLFETHLIPSTLYSNSYFYVESLLNIYSQEGFGCINQFILDVSICASTADPKLDRPYCISALGAESLHTLRLYCILITVPWRSHMSPVWHLYPQPLQPAESIHPQNSRL